MMLLSVYHKLLVLDQICWSYLKTFFEAHLYVADR